MAEERLIDDDKDRKYKIRINENGEEELVIDDSADETEEEEPVFAVPYYEEDDEEATLLTPEQLAEREKLREEEERLKRAKASVFIEKANEKMAEGDFEGARYNISKAEEYVKSGDIYCLQLRILTREFTSFHNLEDISECAENVKSKASAQEKSGLLDSAGSLKNRIEEVSAKCDSLRAENEEKKNERRKLFKDENKKYALIFASTFLPLIVAVILTAVFASMIHTVLTNKYLIATIACGAVAGLCFLATLFTARKFVKANRNMRLNEKDSSTKLGRELLNTEKELELLNNVYGCLQNDIS